MVLLIFMKLKSFKILSIILLIGIVTLSCNKENDGILQTQDALKSNSVKHISIAELFQDKEFKQTIEKIPAKTKNSSLKDGETVMEHDYGFTIERFKAANVKETSEVVSYTMLINRENSNPNTIENLVINTNKLTNAVSAFIYKYESTTPLDNFANFNGTITITPIVYNPNLYNGSQSKEATCIYSYYAYCANHADPINTANCEATIYITISCENTDGGGGGQDPSYSSSVNTGVSTSGNANTGGSGSSVSTSPVGQMSPLELKKKNFTMSLTLEQRTWLLNNPLAATNIYAYLAFSEASTGELGHTIDKTTFAKLFISRSIANPNLKFDINLSSKSPAFIDFSSIDKSTPQGQKLDKVYNILSKSSKFKDLFINMFGQSPLFNVKFQITDIPQNANGYISGKCKVYQYPTNTVPNPFNLIQIDRNYLLKNSDADIALTILHECIHAFLNIKLLNPNIGMSIDNINDLDLKSCINTYYGNFSIAQSQHSFFTDFMIPTIVEVLLEIKNDIFTTDQINALENPTNGLAILYSPIPNSIPLGISDNQVPWNWEDFFYYFAFTVLQNCNAYPFSPYPNIITIQDYFNYHYILAFNAICNPNP